MDTNNNIDKEIFEFIKKYSKMNIGGTAVNCPYWMNRLRDGKVSMRGFANGKGSADEICRELNCRLIKLPTESKFELNRDSIRKFAKRERIGIDCSGLIYRVLDELLRLGYGNTGYKSLDDIFSGGISMTNVKRLTSSQYSSRVKNISDIKLGDMIRLSGGKHAALILNNNQKEILYVHSSGLSAEIDGIHTSIIRITEVYGSIPDQLWLEKAKTGENYGKKYFHPDQGDGVFRLKIFN